MKKLLNPLFALLLAASFQAANANENMSVDDKIKKMDTRLNLTNEQEAQIRPLLQQKKDGTLSKEECHQQVRALLTTEQQIEYDKMKAEKNHKKQQTTPQ